VQVGAEDGPVTGPTSPAVETGVVLVRGLGAAPGRASGAVRLLRSLDEARKLAAGDVLVTHMTSPDWVPLIAAAERRVLLEAART
jgi:pyruvate, water dikinase